MQFKNFNVVGKDNGLNVIEFETETESGVLEITEKQIEQLQEGVFGVTRIPNAGIHGGRATHKLCDPEPVAEVSKPKKAKGNTKPESEAGADAAPQAKGEEPAQQTQSE
jgi:hypothetical protein